METSSTRPSRKSAWRLRARLFGLALLLVSGPWLVSEFNEPSKAEAKLWRADIETVLRLRAAGRMRDSDHAGVELAREWERYMDPSGQSLMTHAQIDAACLRELRPRRSWATFHKRAIPHGPARAKALRKNAAPSATAAAPLVRALPAGVRFPS